MVKPNVMISTTACFHHGDSFSGIRSRRVCIHSTYAVVVPGIAVRQVVVSHAFVAGLEIALVTDWQNRSRRRVDLGLIGTENSFSADKSPIIRSECRQI